MYGMEVKLKCAEQRCALFYWARLEISSFCTAEICYICCSCSAWEDGERESCLSFRNNILAPVN